MLLNCGFGEDLRVPWTARWCNQPILREISPEYSLKGLMLNTWPILWTHDAKSWLIWKDPNAGKDWGQKEKGTTEDKMVGGHHQLDGHGFGWTPGVGDGQEGLVCCGSMGLKESDMIELLNWTEVGYVFHYKYFLFLSEKRGFPPILSRLWRLDFLSSGCLATLT